MRGAVGESAGAPLVGQNPDTLWLEVEQGWSYGAEACGRLTSGCHVRPVRKGAKAHGAVISLCVGSGRIDNMFAVRDDIGEVLECSPSGLWGGESIGRSPTICRRKSAFCVDKGGQCNEVYARRQQATLGFEEFHFRMTLSAEEQAKEINGWDRGPQRTNNLNKGQQLVQIFVFMAHGDIHICRRTIRIYPN